MLRRPMADARTERISPRRLATSSRPLSRGLCVAAALVALGVAIDLQAAREALTPSFASAFSAAATPEPVLADTLLGLTVSAKSFAVISAPLLIAVLAGVVVLGLLQVATFAAAGARAQRPPRFDVALRLQQLLAPERVVDGLVSGMLLIVLVGVAWMTIAPSIRGVLALSSAEPHVLAPQLLELLGTLAFRLALTGVVLGALDYFRRRARYALGLRMTRRELIEEQREQYGDPSVRSERARQRREASTKASS